MEWNDSPIVSRSAFEFNGVIRSAIHRLKYRNESARAEWFGRELHRLLNDLGWQIDVIAPVPLHVSRLKARGYNQSERIARHLSELVDTPVMPALERVRPTRSQVGLSGQQRSENVVGAFAATIDLSSKRVLLVDDVITTGSTIRECALACIRAGAASVVALTIATDA